MKAAEPKRRRTQAERTAGTKKALIEAAIRILNRIGYSGATTALIAKEAGISRGSILHQFGTREQLMLEVVKWVYENELHDYGPLLKAQPTGGHRISEFPEVIWTVLSQPSGVAVLEIYLGARSDPALAKRLRSTQILIERDGFKHVKQFFTGDDATLRAAMRLIVWSARGMSLGQGLTEKPEELQACVQLLRRLFELAEAANMLPVRSSEESPMSTRIQPDRTQPARRSRRRRV